MTATELRVGDRIVARNRYYAGTLSEVARDDRRIVLVYVDGRRVRISSNGRRFEVAR